MTTHGPFTFDTQNGADSDRFIYNSPAQTDATLPAATDTDQNICWAETRPGRSADTGPDSGQGGDPDGFLYSECSSPGANGDTYLLEFDTVLDASAEQWQFNFYSMQRRLNIGENQSLLRVEIEENNSGTWIDVSGELGGAGNDVTTSTWRSQSIDLSESGSNVHATTRVRIWWQSQAGTTWHADIGIDTIEIVGTPLAAVEREQDSFRFEDDDGSESGSTFLAAQNVDISRGKLDPFRVRIGSQLIDDPAAEALTLQVKETSDPASEWRDV